jgi:hypothetical protein
MVKNKLSRGCQGKSECIRPSQWKNLGGDTWQRHISLYRQWSNMDKYGRNKQGYFLLRRERSHGFCRIGSGDPFPLF